MWVVFRFGIHLFIGLVLLVNAAPSFASLSDSDSSTDTALSSYGDSNSDSSSEESNEVEAPLIRRKTAQRDLPREMKLRDKTPEIWEVLESRISWYPTLRNKRGRPLTTSFLMARQTCENIGLRLPFSSECRELQEIIKKDSEVRRQMMDDVEDPIWCNGLKVATEFKMRTGEIQNRPIQEYTGVSQKNPTVLRPFRCVQNPPRRLALREVD